MSSETDRNGLTNRLTARHVLVTAGTLLTTAALVVAIGPVGLLVGLAIGVVQYFFSTPSAFAAGQVAFVVLVPVGGSVPLLILGEVGLVGVLFGSLPDRGEPIRAALVTVIVGASLSAIAWLFIRVAEGIWLGALALALTAAVAAYGLHRYEQVRLGLVEAS
ncbi:MAG TPA: hypothetical protein VFJ06_07645 [Halococcus sp.]|nr:hypothetical protein [Halococcus sp.]